MRRLAILVLALAACTEHGETGDGADPGLGADRVSLADLTGVGIDIVAHFESLDPDTRHVTIEVTHETDGSACITLSSAMLSMFAHPFAAVKRGGYSADDICEDPLFTGDVPAATTDPAVIRLKDTSRTITFDAGDAFAPRDATPVGQTGWAFRAGEEIVFAWSSADDLLGAENAIVSINETHLAGVLRSDGIHVTFPPGTRETGDLTLNLLTRGFCGERCSIEITPSVTHAAVVTP